MGATETEILNKTMLNSSNLMEKVVKMRQYDMCAYRGCTKGRFTTNSRLYRFPKEADPRFPIWIENSGNKRLKFLAESTLRVCGLCQDHFDPRDIRENSYLSRDAVPKKFGETIPVNVDAFRAEPENVPKIIISCKSPETLNIPALLSACTSALVNKFKNVTPIGKDRRVEIDLTKSDDPPLMIPAVDDTLNEQTNKKSDAENVTEINIESKVHQLPSLLRKSTTAGRMKKITSSLQKQIAHLKNEKNKLERKNLMCLKTIRVLRRKLKRASSTTYEEWPAKKTKKHEDFLNRPVHTEPVARKMVKLTFLSKT